MTRPSFPGGEPLPRPRRRVLSLLTLGLALATLPGLSNCGALQDLSKSAVPECHFDARVPKKVSDFDFEGELGLTEDSAEKLEASILGVIEVREFATSLEQELLEVCSGIATDLGSPPPSGTQDAGTACQAAGTAIGNLTFPSASMNVEVGLPECQLDGRLLWACAKECDEDFEGEVPANPPCEDDLYRGRCAGTCEGKCQSAGPQACTGTCWGGCDEGFHGACAGRCKGWCNGKLVDGACPGRCKGTCDSEGAGKCAGACEGECELRKGGLCQTTCEGKCKGRWKGASCLTGPLPPPMSPECEVKCYTRAAKALKCSPPYVKVTLRSEEASRLKQVAGTLEKHLPRLLTIITGKGMQATRMAGNIKGSVEALKQQFTTAANSLGDPMKATRILTHLTTCVLPAFTEAVEKTARLPAILTSATNLAASASELGKSSEKGVDRTLLELAKRHSQALPKPPGLPPVPKGPGVPTAASAALKGKLAPVKRPLPLPSAQPAGSVQPPPSTKPAGSASAAPPTPPAAASAQSGGEP